MSIDVLFAEWCCYLVHKNILTFKWSVLYIWEKGCLHKLFYVKWILIEKCTSKFDKPTSFKEEVSCRFPLSTGIRYKRWFDGVFTEEIRDLEVKYGTHVLCVFFKMIYLGTVFMCFIARILVWKSETISIWSVKLIEGPTSSCWKKNGISVQRSSVSWTRNSFAFRRLFISFVADGG